MLFCFFFFKQKTAYEMRISDWSSDVCSSDLNAGRIGVSLRRSLTLAGLLCVQGFVVGCSEAETLISDAKGLTKVTEAASVEGRKEGVWQPPAGHQQTPLWPRAAPNKIGRAACRERVCQYV